MCPNLLPSLDPPFLSLFDLALTMSGVLTLPSSPHITQQKHSKHITQKHKGLLNYREEVAGWYLEDPASSSDWQLRVEILIGYRVLSDMITTLMDRVC